MIQVTFLGTGAAFASGRQSNLALLVKKDPLCFLIECGPTILHQLAKSGSKPERVTHLFISHRHGDHILGVPLFLLVRAESAIQKPLVIYGNRQVIQVAQKLVKLTFPSLNGRMENVEWVALPDDKAHRLDVTDGLRLSTQPMVHSPGTPVLAIRLDFDDPPASLTYTGDTTYTEPTAEFASGCDLLVHEANFSERLQPEINAADYGHSTARQAGQTAARAGCNLLALIHLSPKYVGQEETIRAEAAQVFEGQVIVPQDGTILFI